MFWWGTFAEKISSFVKNVMWWQQSWKDFGLLASALSSIFWKWTLKLHDVQSSKGAKVLLPWSCCPFYHVHMYKIILFRTKQMRHRWHCDKHLATECHSSWKKAPMFFHSVNSHFPWVWCFHFVTNNKPVSSADSGEGWRVSQWCVSNEAVWQRTSEPASKTLGPDGETTAGFAGSKENANKVKTLLMGVFQRKLSDVDKAIKMGEGI